MSAQPLEARLAHLEGAFIQVDRRLESVERAIESRFNQVDGRFGQLESRLTQMESKFEGRLAIIDQRFNWLIGIVVASWISTIVTVLFHR
jgi:hypothetical protein